MTEKKYPYKFTIEFNRNNPQHIQAAAILNGLPRREKAEYLSRAILSYEEKFEQGEGAVDVDMVKHMIRQILSEEFEAPAQKEKTKAAKSEQVIDVSGKTEVNSRNQDLLKNLSRSMAAFRGQI